MAYRNRHLFTQEQAEFIFTKYQHFSVHELLTDFNSHFGTSLVLSQLKNKIIQLKATKRNIDENYGKYTDEMIDWLKDTYLNKNQQNMLVAELAEKFNERFNTNFSKSAIWHKAYRLMGDKFDRTKEYVPRIKWTKEMINFIKIHYDDYKYSDLSDLVNETFNVKTTASSIEHKVSRLGLKKSKEAIQKIAQSNINARRYWFMPGGISKSRKPIGYERLDKRTGIVWVKVKDPDIFEAKQRVIYEKHYGKLEKGMNVVFLNGDKTDFRIENLAAFSNEDLLAFNLTYIQPNANDDIAKIKYAIAKVKIASRLKKNKEKERKPNGSKEYTS